MPGLRRRPGQLGLSAAPWCCWLLLVGAARADEECCGASAAPEPGTPARTAALEDGVGVLGPAQVVVWSDDTLVAQVPPEWLELRGPIGTVCVTGDDRVGKSTLLTLWGRSLLPDEEFQFTAGHTRTSHTRGLWSAVLPSEATGLDFHLALCDSQGLKQVTEQAQWRLFSANVLVPSVLVYMLINVVQNDQLRDLARMAHQFQQLSADDFGRFGRHLSPHLLVVVREESDLGGEGAEAERDLGQHLEAVLNSPGFDEDKALIKRVFRTREAWSLHELPQEARRALRADAGAAAAGGRLAGGSGEAWYASGEAICQRVLRALSARRADFPQGGPDLAEWYRSVVATVNSRDDGSMERLVGHSERLAWGRQRQQLLQEWGGPTLTLLAGVASLLAFGGCLGRWLDRIAWLTWLVFCVWYIGTSPLVTTPLEGLPHRYCDAVGRDTGPMMRAICREASTQTAAVLLAVALGLLSYPVLAVQGQRVTRLFPLLPGPLRPFGALLLAFLAACGLGVCDAVLRVGTMGMPVGTTSQALAAPLAAAALTSAYEFVLALRHNRRCALASESGRALHFWVSARIEEVRELEASPAWSTHYHGHSKCDAYWRYRSVPSWRHAAVCAQACGLLVWVWLIHPHCDLALAMGAAGNLLHLAWRTSSAAWRCRRRKLSGDDPVDAWLGGLKEGFDDGEGEGEEGGEGGAEGAEPEAAPADGAEPACRRRRRTKSPDVEPTIYEETEEEVARRLQIEEMRRTQEQGALARLWWRMILG